MQRFTDFIDDKEQFAAEVKHSLNQKVFDELDLLKKELATDFINNLEDTDNESD